MRKGERRSRKKSQRRAVPRAASRVRARPGPDRPLFQLSSRHLLVLKELDRLFPGLAPIVDFEGLDPGVESVESVARLLLDLLIQRFERPVFLAFGEINSERLLDHIERRIESGALPLSAREVFSELMFRLFQRLQERDRFGRILRRSGDSGGAQEWLDLESRDRSRTIFHRLATGARIILDEQVEWLRASTIPLPGIPAPCIKPPRSIVSDGSRLLLESSIELSDGEAERWVAHALMQLDDESRRLIYLRRHRGLDAAAIAGLLGLKPFDVLLQLRRAEIDFQDQIRTTLRRFLGRETAESRERELPQEGRVVQWPHGKTIRPKIREDGGAAGEPKERSSARGRRSTATPSPKPSAHPQTAPSVPPSKETADEVDPDD